MQITFNNQEELDEYVKDIKNKVDNASLNSNRDINQIPFEFHSSCFKVQEFTIPSYHFGGFANNKSTLLLKQ